MHRHPLHWFEYSQRRRGWPAAISPTSMNSNTCTRTLVRRRKVDWEESSAESRIGIVSGVYSLAHGEGAIWSRAVTTRRPRIGIGICRVVSSREVLWRPLNVVAIPRIDIYRAVTAIKDDARQTRGIDPVDRIIEN